MKENEAIKELHEIRPRGGIIPQKRAEAIDVAIKIVKENYRMEALERLEQLKACEQNE